MLIIDSLLYYALARYVDLVKPGKWGVAKKWYFLCTPSYWFSRKAEIESKKPLDEDDILEEPVAKNSIAGFRLDNVIKEFKSKIGKGTFRAVDELSFVALEGEITVLLGHNGAGKSTTMNMLSGEKLDEKQLFFFEKFNYNE